MGLVRRNITRTIKNSTESTRETDTPSATTLAFALQTSDAFYVGFRKPFTTRYFALGTANSVTSALTVKYWDGSAWTAVTDLIDQTLGFTTSGFISWTNATDWEKKVQTGCEEELYWVQLTVGTNLHASTTLQAVLNLFCDDTTVRSLYPEIISDTRWLPSSRTDFLEQYLSAKDLVVLHLRKSGAIEDESQIIDVNQVAIAATHAAAYVIKFPLAANEDDRETARECEREMVKSLNLVNLDIDQNDDGVLAETEKRTGTVFRARG